MALFDDIGTRRELVKRLVLAELLARPGRGPLAVRGMRVFAPREQLDPRAQLAPREPPGEAEP